MFKIVIIVLLLYLFQINADEKVLIREKDECKSNCVSKCCQGAYYEETHLCTDLSGNDDLFAVKQPVYYHRNRVGDVILANNFNLLYGMNCTKFHKWHRYFNLQWVSYIYRAIVSYYILNCKSCNYTNIYWTIVIKALHYRFWLLDSK